MYSSTRSEAAFETVIETYLLAHGGYVALDRAGFDRERAIFPATVLPSLAIPSSKKVPGWTRWPQRPNAASPRSRIASLIAAAVAGRVDVPTG
jgi:hypothetical protein